MLADQIEGGMSGITGFLLGRAGRQDVGQDFILRRDEVDHRIVLRPERVRDDKAPHAYGHAHDRLLCFREARTMPDVAAFAAHVGTPNQPVHAGSIFQLCGRPVVSTKAIGALNLLPHGQDVESFPRALRRRQVGNFLVEPPEQPAQQSVGNTFDVRFILACSPKLAQLLEVPVE